MISEQEARQQRLLNYAIWVGILAYVFTAFVLIGRTWISSSRPGEVGLAGMQVYEVVHHEPRDADAR